jgi:excisionase family DNA binding protein
LFRMKYLTIGEMSRLIGVGRSTLRDWEAYGLLSAGRRGTHRRFSPDDLQRGREIVALRARGLNPPVIAEVLGKAVKEPSSDGTGSVNIGKRLRRHRHDAGLTLKQAASLVDVSFSHLSGIERGVANPSVALLERLAHLYGVQAKEIWGEQPTSLVPVPLSLQNAELLESDHGRVRGRAVARGMSICGDLFEVDPGGGSQGQYAHEGEEFVHVMEGTAHIWLDEKLEHVLSAGDSLCFRSDVFHRWANDGPDRLVMLWTSITPPQLVLGSAPHEKLLVLDRRPRFRPQRGRVPRV